MSEQSEQPNQPELPQGIQDSADQPNLVAKAKRSEKDIQYDHFVALFARHERSIRAVIRSLLPSWQDVDDVMQETALVCWRKFDTFEDVEDEQDNFIRWVCVIARFEALRHRRNYARDRLVFSEDIMEILANDSEKRLDKSDQELQAVEGCLKKLGLAEQRLVLSVHRADDSVAQIAKETGQKQRRLYSKVNALRDLISQCVQAQLSEGTQTPS